MEPYPFKFDTEETTHQAQSDQSNVTLHLKNVRGRIPSPQASRIRSRWLEAQKDPAKILAFPCSYDGLSSRLIEEAGFPMIFISGFAVSSACGLPDHWIYCDARKCVIRSRKIARQVTIPILADGDTGYGSPMNVRRTVESFAKAGAAGVMIEDQTWPKRCGHTKGKSVVSREEAYARIRAACDARNQGQDIFILARTDALVVGWDEAITRAKEFKRIGADAIFVEALPDRAAMKKCIAEIDMPMLANIIEGGKTQNLSAKEISELGFAAAAYPWTLVAAKLKSIRDALESLKKSFMVGPPDMILSYDEVIKGVGFEKYWGIGREVQILRDKRILPNLVDKSIRASGVEVKSRVKQTY